MPSSHIADYDVIIAGGGPVGLFLACELRLAGCTVLVLEHAAEPLSPVKALPFGLRGLTLPTIDSLDRRNLLAPLEARAQEMRAGLPAHWRDQQRKPAGHFAGLQFFSDRVDNSAWPWRAGSPRLLVVTMADIEGVLTERALDLGVAIRRGCRVEALRQSVDGVVVHAGGEAIEAGWLVGCDGARSAVRKAAGIGFAGTEPEFTGYSALVRLADPTVLPPGRRHTLTGMYTFTAPGTITIADYDGGAHHRAEPSREHIESVLRRVSGIDVRILALELATTWTDRAFIAGTYRRGRVLLAGDAAHVHAPLGGQGLNLGLGDAMNLGWKLAATVRGEGPSGLLDSYEHERRPVAKQVLDWSRAQVALMRPDSGATALRQVMRDLMETRDGATYFAKRVSGADLRYDLGNAHELLGRSAPDFKLADGTRLAGHMRQGKGLLLDLAPGHPLRSLMAPWHRRLVYIGSETVDVVGLQALLVRPDGVVAWVGEDQFDIDGATTVIARWLGEGDVVPSR